uniref:Uncharacterized protein n=1 Tax=Podarcis muralis TaxID=64176 RepID=A0A670I507_PODMU
DGRMFHREGAITEKALCLVTCNFTSCNEGTAQRWWTSVSGLSNGGGEAPSDLLPAKEDALQQCCGRFPWSRGPSLVLLTDFSLSFLPPQEPDPNNVTYADLNFEKTSKKNPQQVVEISQQSEYASIQTVPPAPNDENVTYADLDMVHLSKAPKRPAPQPEETSSEYASVQVRGK